MPSQFFTILIGLTLAATVFIAEHKPLEASKPRLRLFLLLIISISTFCLSYWKDLQNESDQKAKDNEQRRELATRDSLAQVRTLRAVDSTTRTFYKAMGEYNINVEKGFNGVIKLVRDSSKRVYNQIIEDDPFFGVCLQDKKNQGKSTTLKMREDGRYIILTDFCAYGKAVTNVSIKAAIVEQSGNSYLPRKLGDIYKSDQFGPYSGKTTKHIISLTSENDKIFIFYYGSYTGSDGKKKYISTDLSVFNKSGEPVKEIADIERSAVLKSLNDNLDDVHSFFTSNNIKY